MTQRGRPSRAAIHRRLELAVTELRTRLGGLPSPFEAEGIWNDIWYSEAHSSTAIEGNTLVLREVETLLRHGRAVGNKELREYLEVTGYAAAAKWVYGQASQANAWDTTKLMALTEVRHVHTVAMGPVWDVAPHPDSYDSEAPGNWRKHNIQQFAGGMKPPDFTEVPVLMRDWVDDVCRITADTAPIAEAVAERHYAFERIHPFIDGNGRAGRLLMNLILVRLGFPPAVILKQQRGRYIEALERADRGDIGPLGEVVARAILESLERFIVPAVAGPARLVPLKSLATGELSIEAMRKAIGRSRLRAVRGGDGTWKTTRQAVEEYQKRKHARLDARPTT